MKVRIGTVVGTHGIKGELKIASTTDFAASRYRPGNMITINGREYEIASHRVHKNHDLVRLKGYDNINDVTFLLHQAVYASREDELGEDEHYLSDVVGCEVYEESGEYLGAVVHVLLKPGQDLLEISDGTTTFLLPYVAHFVIAEDIPKKRMTVRLIAGLRP